MTTVSISRTMRMIDGRFVNNFFTIEEVVAAKGSPMIHDEPSKEELLATKNAAETKLCEAFVRKPNTLHTAAPLVRTTVPLTILPRNHPAALSLC